MVRKKKGGSSYYNTTELYKIGFKIHMHLVDYKNQIVREHHDCEYECFHGPKL